jgi:putative MATE family efflux protein
MFLSKKSVDATKGAIFPLVIAYAVPLIISTLVQSLFHAVDIAVLGTMASVTAVASVGATSAITALVVQTFVGLATGTKLIIARQIGMKDTESIRKTVNTSLLLALFLGLFIAVFGCILAPTFMQWVNCPTDCFKGAVLYIRVYFCGAPAILLYNYGSAVLTSSGDTQRPLYYIIAGGLLNVVLNVILCLILPEKVMAVALSTVASQLLGAILVIRRLCVMDGDCKLDIHDIHFNFGALGKILRYGLPIAFSTMIYPLSNLQIQSAINSFDPILGTATAGSSASGTIESIPSAFATAFGATATVFVGQNLGANKPDRVRQSFWIPTLLGVVSTGIIGFAMYLSGEFWLSILLKNDPVAISYGMIRMFYLTLFYFVVAANNSLSHTIQAYGYPAASTVISIVGVLIFRIIWMAAVYPFYQTFDNLMLCFLVSWLTILAANILTISIIMIRFKKGIYKKL